MGSSPTVQGISCAFFAACKGPSIPPLLGADDVKQLIPCMIFVSAYYCAHGNDNNNDNSATNRAGSAGRTGCGGQVSRLLGYARHRAWNARLRFPVERSRLDNWPATHWREHRRKCSLVCRMERKASMPLKTIMEIKEAHTIRVHEADPPMPGMERYRFLVSVDSKVKPQDSAALEGGGNWVGVTRDEAISDAEHLATQSRLWAKLYRDQGSATGLTVIKNYSHSIGL